jgi:hypothetical protein
MEKQQCDAHIAMKKLPDMTFGALIAVEEPKY